MREFLDEYINTLSARRRERVYDLLSAAKSEKGDLDSIAANLKSMAAIAPILVVPEQFNGLIDASRIDGIYRDIFNRFEDLYRTSNQISLLLDTHTSVLSSEIKAREDEIESMTKSMVNYAFTLADNGSYDFSFIETFTDDTMRSELDASNVTDRSGINFALDEGAHVNSAAGNLTLSPAIELAHTLFGKITNSNCAAYVTSDTGISNALNGMVGNGWRVAISSPRPISSTLTGTTVQGAQFEVELSLATPSPSDSIVITPFSEKPFDILKMEVTYLGDQGEEDKKVTLVDGVKQIDKPTTFGFALSTVRSVKMLINQSIYNRGKLPSYQPEDTHRKLYGELMTTPKKEEGLPVMTGIFRRDRRALVRTITSTLNRTLRQKDLRIFKAEVPQINFDPRKGPMNARDFMKNDRRNYGNEAIWKSHSQVNVLFRRMIQEKVLSSSPQSIGGRMISGKIPMFATSGGELNALMRGANIVPVPDEARITTSVDVGTLIASDSSSKFLNYEYDLGFRNIQVGRGVRVFRGAYVTKALPAQSDSGEVKIKVDDTDYQVINSDRDSKQVTSIEYSITNKSEPRYEEDWIPIIPINKNNFITAERVFFNEAGAMRFRFPAVKSGAASIYRNGYRIQFNNVTWVESTDMMSHVGFRLPIGTIFPNDIYTVDYEAYGDQTFINFEAKGVDTTNLASAYDENGAGQTFFGTYNGRTIGLNYEPYVNADQIETFGSYSTTLGFTGTYQPITIVMSDGTIALNQTNYKGLIQNSLTDFGEDQTAYIHSGRNIVFNRNVDERFTVYYQYLPSNLKARIVLRVNDENYVSPQVDSIQIKTKTRKANPKKEI